MLKKLLPLVILITTVALIAATNFSSSYLIGWDNLLPELNFALNIKRAIFSVWQLEGLGFVTGNAAAADLPRQILLLPLILVLPLNFVRQVYIFAMLLVGVLGAFFLIKKLVFYGNNRKLNWIIPLIGALFYLLNLSTVQTFFVPFEPLITHYAFLPWLILSALNLIANKDKKSLLFFLLVNILAIPQAEVPTVFFVYLFSLGFFLLVLVWETRVKSVFWASLKVLFLTLILNAFWLLPFIYFYSTNSSVAFEAKANQISTQTVFLQNKEFGNLSDVISLKGFWFQNVDPNRDGTFEFMMKPWKDYFSGFPTFLGLTSFLFILLGFIYVKRRSPFVIPFSALFLLSFTMLATNTPPFSWIDSGFRSIPIFKEVFRFPFTKFSILASLTYSFFFAIGVGKLISVHPGKVKSLIVIGLSWALIISVIFPIFKGNLFYEKERVNFPPEYRQLFQYFSTKPSTARIADFPQQTFWGWNYYRWGYGGSGFLWYAIPQPILDRAYDVWSRQSENYYWEISYALYSKNAPLFEKVLRKYKVEYLILDHNVQSSYSQKSLYVPELSELLTEIPDIKRDASFGQIDVYKIPQPTSLKTISTVVNGYKFGDFDAAYSEYGDYLTAGSKEANIVYPFRSLFSGKNEEDKEFRVKFNTNSIEIISNGEKADVPKIETSYSLKTNVLKNCDNFRKGKISASQKNGSVVLYSKSATACTSIQAEIVPSQGYLLSIDNKNIKGRGIHLWVLNESGENPLIDTYLSENTKRTTSYFVIPPQDEFSKVYSIHLDNVSIGDETQNEVGKVSLYQIPYWAITSVKTAKSTGSPMQVITSNQAYDSGWKAYFIRKDANPILKFLPFLFRTELKNHVLVNNWENGWILTDQDFLRLNDSEINIVFFPQYLEYLGFLVALGTVIYAIKRKSF